MQSSPLAERRFGSELFVDFFWRQSLGNLWKADWIQFALHQLTMTKALVERERACRDANNIKECTDVIRYAEREAERERERETVKLCEASAAFKGKVFTYIYLINFGESGRYPATVHKWILKWYWYRCTGRSVVAVLNTAGPLRPSFTWPLHGESEEAESQKEGEGEQPGLGVLIIFQPLTAAEATFQINYYNYCNGKFVLINPPPPPRRFWVSLN